MLSSCTRIESEGEEGNTDISLEEFCCSAWQIWEAEYSFFFKFIRRKKLYADGNNLGKRWKLMTK